jgi:dipeptidyl aminopeptidase/acylaminoacyl peptidase
MFKRAMFTFAELAVSLGLLALLTAGCGSNPSVASPTPETTTDDPAAAPSRTLQVNKSRMPTPMPASPQNTSGNQLSAKLIPRDVLFGNPQRAQARLSPDGKYLSYLAPVDGVLNVWVAPADDMEAAAPVTEDKVRGIRGHSWAYDSKHILYSQDKGGDENWHVYATNVETKQTTDLTPIDGVNAEISGISQKFPGEVLIGLNDRNPQLHDIYRVNIATGERQLIQENPGLAGFVADDDFNVRMAVTFTPTGGQAWLRPEGEANDKGYADWKMVEEFGPEDAMTSGPAGFDLSGKLFYYQDSKDRNTSGLFVHNLETDEIKLLAENDKCDAGGIMADPQTGIVQAVSFTYDKTDWLVLDDAIKADIEFLEKEAGDAEFAVSSRTLDDKTWMVAFIQEAGPVKYYRYTRGDEPKLEFLFNNRDDLEDYELVKMHPAIIKSRDGLDLVSYLSLPPGTDDDGDGVPSRPVPMVLDVHGGPWARDEWGYNPSAQWLANRGYAVLSVNYRGSTGFGKQFINAANGEWSGKMHDDLLDAVNWAVDRGIADRDKICIMGGSYGGYATLVGLTYTPDVFACGVDIVGPSSLVTLLENAPPYWAPFMPVMKIRVGDWTTEEGRAALLARSPLTKVDEIKKPLLIGQGANDPRVTQLEADQIVDAMQSKEIPVTYVLYPDEGHGFARPENNMSFNAVTEAFLAEQLGGRYEEIGDDFEGASIHVPAGADGVPGLAEKLSDDRQQMPPQGTP